MIRETADVITRLLAHDTDLSTHLQSVTASHPISSTTQKRWGKVKVFSIHFSFTLQVLLRFYDYFLIACTDGSLATKRRTQPESFNGKTFLNKGVTETMEPHIILEASTLSKTATTFTVDQNFSVTFAARLQATTFLKSCTEVERHRNLALTEFHTV